MSKFLKLSTRIINTSRISSIYMDKESVPKKIIIYMVQDDLSGFFAMGSGWLSTQDYKYNICEQKDPNDFVTVSKWIDKIE